MARRRQLQRQEAERELARRRNSAAHRSMRRRAAQGKGAHVAPASGAPDAGAPASGAPDAGATDPGEAGGEAGPEAAAPIEERVPTSELRTPEWLAAAPVAGAAATTAGATNASTAAAERLAGSLPDWVHQDAGSYEPTTPAPSAPDAHESEDQASDDQDAVAESSDSAVPALEPEPAPDAAPEPAPDASPDAAETQIMEPVDAGDTAVMPAVAAGAMGAAAMTESASAASPVQSAHGTPGEPAATEPSTPVAEAKPRRRRRALAIVPLVIVALAVLYVGAQALLSGSVPRETETLGLSIGGMSVAEATGAVDARSSDVAGEALTLEAGGLEYETTAGAAGLGVDAEATVAQVTGFTLMPDRLWMHITGGGHIEPVTVVDESELAATMAEAATVIDGAAEDATVSIAGDAVEVVEGRPAVTVDQESSAQLVAAAWPDSQTVALIAEVEDPSITDEDAQAFANTLREVVFAGPITLVGEDVETTVEAATVADHAAVVVGTTGLELEIDGPGLATQIVADDPELATEGENASVSFDDDHEIVIDEGTPGITIDGDALVDVITAAAARPDRTGELPYTAADAEVSPEDLGLADLQEIVASFDTPLTAEPIRTQNLRTAAADVEGTLLMPGDEFNLHELLSPITEEEGYGQAHVIVDGILTSGLGGGLSQMATTSYNAAYFAGYELLQHRPHSVWFTRYPAGRESTLWGTTINVRFTNNTPYAALINSYVDGGRLHVDIWSTPHFEVENSVGPKTNVTQPGVKEVRAANCEAKGPGQPGFTITNTRRVFLDGEQVDENIDTWTYQPDDAIECVTDDDEDDDS
ncbi:VanW family protein [uncultured Demequina sp.]|uniref:VanW family protein n=1 Tax=uncultured Demequina sp. TaxID=693499 RepID=UPI0025FDE944|nr:VanW family protein [uncultured Demequina sp.]